MVGTVTGATISGRVMARVSHYKRLPTPGSSSRWWRLAVLAAEPRGLPFLRSKCYCRVGWGIGTLLPVTTVSHPERGGDAPAGHRHRGDELFPLSGRSALVGRLRRLRARRPPATALRPTPFGHGPRRKVWSRSSGACSSLLPSASPWLWRGSSRWRSGRCAAAPPRPPNPPPPERPRAERPARPPVGAGGPPLARLLRRCARHRGS